MNVLTPPPEAVADLLLQLIQQDWPTTDEERRCSFARLGLQDGDALPPGDAETDSEMRRIATSLPGVDGISTMFRDEFLGLSLFCYDEPLDDGPAARAGHAGLRDEFDRRLGSPLEEWGPSNEPACLWESESLLIELYCFQRLRSGVMIGVSHAERSAAHTAAHDTRESAPGPVRPPGGSPLAPSGEGP